MNKIVSFKAFPFYIRNDESKQMEKQFKIDLIIENQKYFFKNSSIQSEPKYSNLEFSIASKHLSEFVEQLQNLQKLD
jgi:hypothetical protein